MAGGEADFAKGATYDVLGIGNAIVDVLAHTDDATLAAHKLTKGTMALIDAAAAERLYAAMGPGVEVSGGSVANTIAGVASLGGRGAYIGKVRADQLGEVFAHDLKSLGVAFATPPATDGPPTARSFILVTPDAQRTMNTFLGACANLRPQDIDEAQVKASAITYLEGYLWDPPLAKDAFRRAIRTAHDAGRLVALSLSDPFCVDRWRDEFRELIAGEIDVLLANEAEICSLYQVAAFDEAITMVRRDVRIAAVTRSEKGAIVLSGGESYVVSAIKPKELVDTTGAGDLFAAGLLFGLARGFDLGACGRLGVIAAAEVISHFGARPQVPLAELAAAEITRARASLRR